MLEPLPRQAASADTANRPEQHVLHRDYETRSVLSLKAVGAHRYAAHSRTEVLCCAYAVDDNPVQLWVPGDPVPREFIEAAQDPARLIAAHGDHFETQIERHIMAPRFDFPETPLDRHHCTMAAASAAGLPTRLSAAADALELVNRKDKAGERLMHQTSKPRRARKDEDPAGTYWFDDPERLQRLGQYCRQDVETERELYDRLPSLPPTEHANWQLSCRINDRGFHVDRQLFEAARRIAEAAAPEIDSEIAEITGGVVTTVNQVARLLQWLREHRCTMRKLDRKAIERQLERAEELEPEVRRVLELRLGGAQSAVKKIDALLCRAGGDDRVRSSFRFHGAATGRWSGEGFQPQNLKRPVVEDLDAAIAAVKTGVYEQVRELNPRPLSLVGDCIRAMITAAPGHRLIGADFSAVESTVLAWVSGEEEKVESYRQFHATRNPADEPYRIIAGKILHKSPVTISKEERGVGKVCDLAFGYMGGLNAWRNFEPDRFTDDEVTRFRDEWRAAHPKIKCFWYATDRAAWDAVRERGRVFRCGPVAFKCAGAFLQLKLPSGRKISYPYPRIIGGSHEQRVVFADNAAGQFKDCRHGQGAYGGVWVENIVSGIARDILAEAMQRIEAAGYPITLHVHDEIVAEVPIGIGSEEEFTHLMTRRPSWALDLPIAVSAWSGPRYTKGG